MDELNLVRDLRRSVPTITPRAEQAARARLTGALATPARRRPARRKLFRLAVPGLSLAAAGVAVALAVSVGGSSPGGSGTRTPGQAPPTEATRKMSGRQVLLAAASVAEKRPATDGRYWHIRMTDELAVQGKLFGNSVDESWAGKDGVRWDGRRDLGGGHPYLGKTRSRSAFELGDKPMSLATIRRLPADPAALNKWLRRFGHRPLPPESRNDFYVTSNLIELLVSVPATPQVRAAAFRALATTPGVKSLGSAKDEEGRVGQVIKIDSEDRFIIDPKSSLLLSWQALSPSDGKARSRTYLQIGWTNEQPHVPELP